MAHSPGLRRWVERSALARPLTSRFISGATLDEGLSVASHLHRQGISATLDRLGENVQTEAEASIATEAYLRALERIAGTGTGATVSGKLTQFGLDVSDKVCVRNAMRIAACARQTGSRLEVDMEGSPYTQRTLEIVHQLHAAHQSVRAVIQAYLYRSVQDIAALNAARIPVRLCKGAYNEPPSIAYPKKRDVDENFLSLASVLLVEGVDPALATHDAAMISATRSFASSKGLTSDVFEFQMLFGIRRDLQQEVVQHGYRLRVYVPYGEAWYPYFMRRMAERPANLLFVLRNLFR